MKYSKKTLRVTILNFLNVQTSSASSFLDRLEKHIMGTNIKARLRSHTIHDIEQDAQEVDSPLKINNQVKIRDNVVALQSAMTCFFLHIHGIILTDKYSFGSHCK